MSSFAYHDMIYDYIRVKGKAKTGRISKDLGIPYGDVDDACMAMMAAGEIVGVMIGVTYTWSLPGTATRA